ncbi:bifunctional adenosylcobinamide kinase/adenosylcobinamide-phosphate guanylyltransferase [uncultured Methylibium sp.]|uniref:bifunctional adenosylcobinamide kinase/adenosylcobinamide-phosphate guanylyltransferase n=1 Tax=uncultured Methylibium sp. TaxID=381093 RepID=UPI0025ED07DD|nr:bifunctional adenosylcobinamide kinase/adenosylcobinamide-phosphate guanylyltransferase [uncultured Methylibium sp.]
MTLHLIVGGMRSGKSAQAQRLAAASGCEVVVIATALAADDEMRARIARHRADRPAHWRSVDLPHAPLALASAVEAESRAGRCLLIDCLTLWITQVLAPPPGHAPLDAQAEVQALLAALPRCAGPVIAVGNEIGLGVVPMDAVSRRVVDVQGRLHQQLAAQADRVSLMVAGLPVAVKGPAA